MEARKIQVYLHWNVQTFEVKYLNEMVISCVWKQVSGSHRRARTLVELNLLMVFKHTLVSNDVASGEV